MATCTSLPYIVLILQPKCSRPGEIFQTLACQDRMVYVKFQILGQMAENIAEKTWPPCFPSIPEPLLITRSSWFAFLPPTLNSLALGAGRSSLYNPTILITHTFCIFALLAAAPRSLSSLSLPFLPLLALLSVRSALDSPRCL